ncbi:RNA polymerase sigma factor [Hwanghaeella sp.]|uniref:RNA polymerase sigma factor n=1 Tax=Hwanghaeella sp. TaxID=2605943 RepID=UPI003CCC26BC
MGKDLKGLFRDHRRELQAYLTETVRDPELAADLTQETFLRYARQIEDASGAVQHVRSYLYRTARNLAIDHVRQQARQRTDAVENDILDRLADDTPSVEDAAISRQRLDVLRQAVGDLPDRTRRIFILSRLEGMKQKEVAELLKISESSVRKHLAMALQHVMQRVQR